MSPEPQGMHLLPAAAGSTCGAAAASCLPSLCEALGQLVSVPVSQYGQELVLGLLLLPARSLARLSGRPASASPAAGASASEPF